MRAFILSARQRLPRTRQVVLSTVKQSQEHSKGEKGEAQRKRSENFQEQNALSGRLSSQRGGLRLPCWGARPTGTGLRSSAPAPRSSLCPAEPLGSTSTCSSSASRRQSGGSAAILNSQPLPTASLCLSDLRPGTPGPSVPSRDPRDSSASQSHLQPPRPDPPPAQEIPLQKSRGSLLPPPHTHTCLRALRAGQVTPASLRPRAVPTCGERRGGRARRRLSPHASLPAGLGGGRSRPPAAWQRPPRRRAPPRRARSAPAARLLGYPRGAMPCPARVAFLEEPKASDSAREGIRGWGGRSARLGEVGAEGDAAGIPPHPPAVTHLHATQLPLRARSTAPQSAVARREPGTLPATTSSASSMGRPGGAKTTA